MFPQSRRSDSRSPPIGLGCLAAWSVPIDARRRRKSTPDSPGESVGWLLRKASRYSHFPVQRLNKPNILRAGADGQAYPSSRFQPFIRVAVPDQYPVIARHSNTQLRTARHARAEFGKQIVCRGGEHGEPERGQRLPEPFALISILTNRVLSIAGVLQRFR